MINELIATTDRLLTSSFANRKTMWNLAKLYELYAPAPVGRRKSIWEKAQQ